MRRERLAVFVLAAAALWMAAVLLVRGGGAARRGDTPSTESASAASASDAPAGSQPGASRGPSRSGGSKASSAPTREPVLAGDVLRLRVFCEDEALAGAEVFALPLDEELQSRLASRVGVPRQALLRAATRVVTDEQGWASLTGVAAPLLLAARGPGSGPGGRVVPDGRASSEIAVHVPRQCVLRGRVLSHYAGDDFADIVVTGRRAFWHELEDVDDPDRWAAMFFQSTTRPDAEGRFELEGLGPGYADVEARGTGRASVREVSVLLPREAPLDLLLLSGAVLSGRVVAEVDHQPLVGALVRQDLPFARDYLLPGPQAWTDGDGRFSLLVLDNENEKVLLTASHSEHGSATLDVAWDDVVAGREVEISLPEGCAFEAVFLDAKTGKPIEGPFLVQYRVAGADRWLGSVQGRRTDGKVRVPSLPSGRSFDLLVRTDHYGQLTFDDVDLCGRTQTYRLDPPPRLRGRVVGEGGEPLAARLRLFFEDSVGNRIVDVTTQSDEQTGAFDLLTYGEGTYALDVWAPGHAWRRLPAVNVTFEREKELLEIRLARGTTLSGRVLGRETGRPIVGASVRLGDREVATGDVRAPLELVQGVRTDGEGGFRLPGVAVGEDVPLLVQAEGFVQRAIILSPSQMEATGGAVPPILLERGARIVARMIAEDGRPFGPMVYAWAIGAGESHLSVPGSDGSVVIDGLTPGRWRVEVIQNSPTLASLRMLARSVEVDLQAGEERRIDVRLGGVRVRGHLTGAAIDALLAGNQAARVRARPVVAAGEGETSCRSGGRDYVLRGLTPGRYRLSVESPDRSFGFEVTKEVEFAAAGTYEVDFEVPATGVRGRVLDGRGEAVLEARIEARPAEAGRASARTSVVSGAEGRFELQGLGPGRYEVTVWKEGCGKVGDQVDVPGGSREAQEREYVLEPEARLRVVARGRGGGALEEARVTAGLEEGPAFLTYAVEPVEGEAGTWRVVGLGAGTARVRVEASGHFPEERRLAVRAGSESSLAVELRRTGSLRVRLKHAGGGPAAGVGVELVDEETGDSVAAWLGARGVTSTTGGLYTDEDGELVLGGLPEGRYLLVSGAARRHVEVPPGTLTEATLVLVP